MKKNGKKVGPVVITLKEKYDEKHSYSSDLLNVASIYTVDNQNKNSPIQVMKKGQSQEKSRFYSAMPSPKSLIKKTQKPRLPAFNSKRGSVPDTRGNTHSVNFNPYERENYEIKKEKFPRQKKLVRNGKSASKVYSPSRLTSNKKSQNLKPIESSEQVEEVLGNTAEYNFIVPNIRSILQGNDISIEEETPREHNYVHTLSGWKQRIRQEKIHNNSLECLWEKPKNSIQVTEPVLTITEIRKSIHETRMKNSELRLALRKSQDCQKILEKELNELQKQTSKQNSLSKALNHQAEKNSAEIKILKQEQSLNKLKLLKLSQKNEIKEYQALKNKVEILRQIISRASEHPKLSSLFS